MRGLESWLALLNLNYERKNMTDRLEAVNGGAQNFEF